MFFFTNLNLLFKKNKNKGGGHARTTVTGTTVGVDVTGSEKVWNSFQAIGDIAFAYAYSTVLIEIQASQLYIYIQIITNFMKYDLIVTSL